MFYVIVDTAIDQFPNDVRQSFVLKMDIVHRLK